MRAVLVLSAVVCTVCFVACGGQPGEAPTASIQAKKTWPRAEFKKMLEGKTEKEVLELAGKPDSTTQTGERVLWTYRESTVDPITGKIGLAFLHIKDGVVESVDF